VNNLEPRPNNPQSGYDSGTVQIFAATINHLNKRFSQNGKCFEQQLILQNGLKTFGKKGEESGTKEDRQLLDLKCFIPIKISELNEREIKRAVEALMFLTEKKDGTIKVRVVYNGKPTRQ
jgi:hypothetical protein